MDFEDTGREDRAGRQGNSRPRNNSFIHSLIHSTTLIKRLLYTRCSFRCWGISVNKTKICALGEFNILVRADTQLTRSLADR